MPERMTTWRERLRKIAEEREEDWDWDNGPDLDPDEPHFLFNPLPPGTPCPDGPHRFPQGPNEDVAVCMKCGSPSWGMRPEGEEFGGHAPDCSLPRRHESYCKPGGNGHPAPEVMRG